MSNEFFFFTHVLCVLAFSIIALRLGAVALVALIALEGVLANVFVVKQMVLFGFTVTCSDVYAVGSILGLNLLQEYFGRDTARKAIPISFVILVFFVVVSQMHLLYKPSDADVTQGAFELIFHATPRIMAASMAVYYIVQRIDVVLFAALKTIFQGRYLGLRLTISLFVTQLIDTVLFTFLGLYGIVSSLLDIMIVSFLVKCVVIGSGASFATLTRRWVYRNELKS